MKKLIESVNNAMEKNKHICPYCDLELLNKYDDSRDAAYYNCPVHGDIEAEELEEANVTGNMDGGSGPPQTPKAFSKSGEEDEKDNAEWFGAKKVKRSNKNFTQANVGGLGESKYKTIMLDKIGIKKQEKQVIVENKKISTKQELNILIKEFNEKLDNIEGKLNRSFKLKNEFNVDYFLYWKETKNKVSDISERLIKLYNLLDGAGE
jgi:hypothetical protein